MRRGREPGDAMPPVTDHDEGSHRRQRQGESSHPARNYSIRRPDIARAITSCWISLVPSKIVWIKLSAFSGVVPYRTVPLIRCDAFASPGWCCPFRLVLGMD